LYFACILLPIDAFKAPLQLCEDDPLILIFGLIGFTIFSHKNATNTRIFYMYFSHLILGRKRRMNEIGQAKTYRFLLLSLSGEYSCPFEC